VSVRRRFDAQGSRLQRLSIPTELPQNTTTITLYQMKQLIHYIQGMASENKEVDAQVGDVHFSQTVCEESY
jgi:hypothetical protein